jgi:SEC-C motif-containing protein
MRSRYSAYALEKVDYIVDTHEPEGRGDVDRDAAEEWAKQAEWLGLEIVDTALGQPNDSTGEVEFIASYSLKGVEQKHHERSRFEKQDGKWFYVDGEMVKAKPVVREEPKVGRNEPCPCGSGKKFKKCCG